MFKKYVIVALAFSMLTSLVFMPNRALTSSPGLTPTNYDTFIVDEAQGTFPVTLDPANCYDTASAECIFNSMETLLFFLGENPDKFTPMLATQATVAPPDPASPPYTNFTVYFKIRCLPGSIPVPFQTSCRTVSWGPLPDLTTMDVVYSLQRFLVHDYAGAATWMLLEFLMDTHAGDPTGDPNGWQTEINDSIVANSTHVWLNAANPRDPNTGLLTGNWHLDPPQFAPVNMFMNQTTGEPTNDGTFDGDFYSKCAGLSLDYPLRIVFQIIAQPWCSIMSQQWVRTWLNAQAIPGYPIHGATNNDWPGNDTAEPWSNYFGWEASDSPLDKLPTSVASPGVMCGTGPYVLDTYDAASGWSSGKNDLYWGGWPAKQPSPPYPPEFSSGITPAGYLTRLTVVNTRNTAGRIADLISGAVDIAAINRANAYKLHYPGTANSDRNGPTLEGIRLNYPIPTLEVESQHYTFIVDPTPGNTYGIINNNDTLSADGIPANFFNNTHVRLAFTYLWNYTYTLQTLFFGEGYQPLTCAPNGLPYVNPANPMYTDSPTAWPSPTSDEAKAKAELDLAVFGGVALNTVGFTVDLCYCDAGASVLDLEAAVNKLGADYGLPYYATHSNIPWNDFIPAIDSHLLPTFRVGWLADYVDIHDFLFSYAASQGEYGKAQRIGAYHNEVDQIDIDLKEAARTPDGPARQALYYDAEAKLYTLNPTVFIMVPVGRGYMRTWVRGHYYNPLYPGIYAYNHWKAEEIRGDVNHDGVVDFLDYYEILEAYGSYIGKSGMPVIHQRWNFYCDIDGNPYDSYPPGDGGWRDRRIDSYDVSACLENLGEGVPQPMHGGNVYLVATASEKTVGIDQNVSVAVKINNAVDLTGYEIRLLYNASLLTAVSWRLEPMPGWPDPQVFETVQGMIGDKMLISVSEAIQVGESYPPFSGNTTLVTLIFSGLAEGNATLDISTSVLAAGEPLKATPYNPINGQVRVGVIAGDVDENGKVDMGDIVALCDAFGSTKGADGNYWHKPPCIICPHNPNCDIDNNGQVDMGDIVTGLDHFGQHYP